jgi:uncharacterized repeat protein (TIGR03803 family)
MKLSSSPILLVASLLAVSSAQESGSAAPAGLAFAGYARFSSPLPSGFTVLHSFGRHPDGRTPFGGVTVDPAGNIFGTTDGGGASNCGTVYELIPSGSSYTEGVIHSFDAHSDGCHPFSNPIEDQAGNLYATASLGGQGHGGTVIALSPAGSTYQETSVHEFGNGVDGKDPYGAPLDEGFVLYATVGYGGKYGFGAIVALTVPDLSESDVYDFKGPPADGAYPGCTLVQDSAGALYGTTYYGGTATQGTVFRFVPSGSGGIETVIWNFQGDPDGTGPYDGAIIDEKGNVYGETAYGGLGDGIVYKLTPREGGYKETILYAFGGGHPWGVDGIVPNGTLLARGDFLYGAASNGGLYDDGTLFKISTRGAGFTKLHDFQGAADGRDPTGTLVASGRALFGTTAAGGRLDKGVVFRFVPP